MTNLEIQKAYMGNTEISKIYLGAEVIYPSGTPPTPIVGTPLTFEILSAGTIGWEKHNTNVDIQYSTDNGQTWSTFTSLNVSAGDTVQFRGNGRTATNSSNYSRFTSTGAVFNASGNLYSLLDSTNYDSIDSLATYGDYTFVGLFRGNEGIRSAAFDLPATTLASSCYMYMFSGCTNLTTAPELPATAVTDYCYSSMFAHCTSLTTAPDLPATTLDWGSYEAMFSYCSSLNYIKCLATDITESDCTNDWVAGVATAGTFIKSSAMTSWTTGVDGIPTNWTVRDDGAQPVYSAMPLTMEVLGDGDLLWQVTKNDSSFQPRVIEYSKNGGEWTSITAGTSTSVSIPVLTGDIIQFRGNNSTYATNGQNLHALKIRYQTPFNIYGNINSLISADNFTGLTSFGTDYTFYGFFANSGVRDASNLVMATTGLSNYCYGNMFISAPNLINAPELPAITLTEGCYQNMFKNDSNLVSIKCLARSISATYCTKDWVSGVAASGTFVKHPNMTSWTTGTSGIPSGWTVEDAIIS